MSLKVACPWFSLTILIGISLSSEVFLRCSFLSSSNVWSKNVYSTLTSGWPKFGTWPVIAFLLSRHFFEMAALTGS